MTEREQLLEDALEVYVNAMADVISSAFRFSEAIRINSPGQEQARRIYERCHNRLIHAHFRACDIRGKARELRS